MNRSERRDVLLQALLTGTTALFTVLPSPRTRKLSRRRSRWRLAREGHRLRHAAELFGAFAVGLGLPYAGRALRSRREVLRRRKEGAASRTPTPPTPELVAAVSAGGPGVHARVAAAEHRPPPMRAGTIDLGPGPTRTVPSHELD